MGSRGETSVVATDSTDYNSILKAPRTLNDETGTPHPPQHTIASATFEATTTRSRKAPKSNDRISIMKLHLRNGDHPSSAPSTFSSYDLHDPYNCSLSKTSGTNSTFWGGREPRKRFKGGKRKRKFERISADNKRFEAQKFGVIARAFFRTSMSGERSSLILAVALWYSLGIISISTSKILLTPRTDDYYYHFGGVPPLVLTLQQFALGSTLLWTLLRIKTMGSKGLQPWDSLLRVTAVDKQLINGDDLEYSLPTIISKAMKSEHCKYLIWAGMCFTAGFYATNVGFGGASASYVETIKAAEPITSAVLAVTYGLDVLNGLETASLGTIVLGVLLSTLGNASTSPAPSLASSSSSSHFYSSLLSCATVMVANLCFSFRGLYQKLFRSKFQELFTGNCIGKDTTTIIELDDLNLQFKMQQLGVSILFFPAVLTHGFSILRHLIHVYDTVGIFHSGLFIRYTSLALLNGFAFTTYNLASTYLLSRISVVQHAALNCIRRIFAVIVTCFVFDVSLTLTGVLGICISFGGFMVFSFAKARKKGRAQSSTVSNSILPLISGKSDEHLHGS